MDAPDTHRSRRPHPRRSAPPPPARLALRPPTFPPGPVCGAWWPHSDDLAVELPALAEAFALKKVRVTRIASHRDTWSATPHAVPVPGHTVQAAWLVSGCDPHTIRLFSHNFRRWDLLVVPHDTADTAAARLMTAASDRTNRLTASALVAAERRLLPRSDTAD
ncbi:DUF5994 family protein [Streptomyces spectabilis]|uniref:Uncharacterized protein n=1 Tax=Streptomyces spectabilis TaxID=68270 RepID=A0A516R108_STRST|nr:DUF5994 family protein [Streptomyces spectabilis]QDQ09320.1 hypothetical protein FH965_01030 [Streptomyces spectabilis]